MQDSTRITAVSAVRGGDSFQVRAGTGTLKTVTIDNLPFFGLYKKGERVDGFSTTAASRLACGPIASAAASTASKPPPAPRARPATSQTSPAPSASTRHSWQSSRIAQTACRFFNDRISFSTKLPTRVAMILPSGQIGRPRCAGHEPRTDLTVLLSLSVYYLAAIIVGVLLILLGFQAIAVGLIAELISGQLQHIRHERDRSENRSR